MCVLTNIYFVVCQDVSETPAYSVGPSLQCYLSSRLLIQTRISCQLSGIFCMHLPEGQAFLSTY